MRIVKYSTLLVWVLASASSHASNVFGYYYVPVSDPALEPYATIEVTIPSSQLRGYPNNVRFMLPSGLVGQDRWFDLAQQGDLSWRGAGVVGECTLLSRSTSCEVRFDSISVDLQEVRRALIEQGFTGAELAGRLEVARLFSGEPIGVFFYRLP
jgi:hypothetical protein